jgi:hypothetical protein
MKGVRFFADDGKETELGAEPHWREGGSAILLWLSSAPCRCQAYAGLRDRAGSPR